MHFPLRKKRTPSADNHNNGAAGPAPNRVRGQRPGETLEQLAERRKANFEAFLHVSELFAAELAACYEKDFLSKWRLRPPPTYGRTPLNAREQANVLADAPWEPWHDLPPILEGVPAPEWGPKPDNRRGFGERNFIGPLEVTHKEYEVDYLYFPVMPPAPEKWWKIWQKCDAHTFAILLRPMNGFYMQQSLLHALPRA
ncbi:hypothetical protein Efla_001399 [Eimeria flavescens]